MVDSKRNHGLSDMAMWQRIHWTFLRLTWGKTGLRVLWMALLTLLVLWGVFRPISVNALAKSNNEVASQPTSHDPTAPSVPWRTLYEPNSPAMDEPLSVSPRSRTSAGVKIPSKPAHEKPSENGETLFLQTYQLLNAGEHAQALQVAQSMVERFPNFQLGQLLYADLMAGLAGGIPERESLLQHPDVRRRLSQLKAEALQRAQRQDKAFFAGKYPAPVRFLSPNVTQVVVVDAQKSRLYVLANQWDGAGKRSFNVVFDAYVSIGNNGMGKWREGDGKTPAGVYFVQKHLTDPMLPDLYGSGALTLDYPSPIDKEQKRTGSGIWLHGSPSEQYARAPTSTDGCVVLANDDMLRLVRLGLKADTPVIIAEQLNWHDAAKAPHLNARTQTWPQPEQIRKTPGDWQLVSAFEWTDKQHHVAVLSHELQATGRAPKRLHSYWVLDGKRWKEVGRQG
jgi:L,D-peptidoglycan transpeptidase YkuD (ErfK/YbiS/YcfS/YnhG family)